MAMKKWSEWLDDVMPSLPGCNTELAEDAIRKAAIELCQLSNVVQVDLDTITTESGVTTYDVSVDNQTDIERIESVSIDGETVVRPIDSYRLLPDSKEIEFFVAPDGAYSLDITVSTCPRTSAVGVDSRVFFDYREPVASGALSKLMVLPKKPWTELALAKYHRDIFMAGVRAAQADAIKRSTTGLLKVAKAFRV